MKVTSLKKKWHGIKTFLELQPGGNHVMFIKKCNKNKGHRARFWTTWMAFIATLVPPTRLPLLS